MMKKTKTFLLVVLGFLIFPISAYAFEVQMGEIIEIDKGVVVNDDLLVVGANVRINGQLNGDIKAMGSIVEINGSVNGDVTSVGSQIIVRGNIGDDIYAAGGQVNIEGKIKDNAFIVGGNVYVSDNVEIGRDLRVYGGMVYLDGKVAGDVVGKAGQLKITNNIDGDLKGEFDKLIIGPNVKIGGGISYSSPEEAEINTSADINGLVDWTKTEPREYYQKKDGFWAVSLTTSIMWFLIKIISLMLSGIILILIFPKEIRKITDRLAGDPGNSILWGIIICIIVPVLALLILITIIGIPLAMILISIYGISIYLAKVIVGLWVGKSLLAKISKKKEVSLLWSVVIGTAIIGILCVIPIAGFIIKIIVTVFGIGVIFMSLRAYFAKRK